MINDLDAEIEADIKKEEALKKDPFEKAKQKLKDNQETVYEVPDHKYVDIKLPAKGIIGEDCVIKISKKVPKLQVVISHDVQWKKRDKYDKKSKPEMVCRAFIIEEFKNVKEVRVKWQDVATIAQKRVNLLKPDYYMVEVRAWNNEAWEETTARRLIKVDVK